MVRFPREVLRKLEELRKPTSYSIYHPLAVEIENNFITAKKSQIPPCS